MTNVTSKRELSHPATESNSHLFDDWFDPIETGIRDRVRGLIEEMIHGELDAALSRPRYGRRAGHSEGDDVTAVITGHRHGSRVRTLTGTFGKTKIAVPRARLNGSVGKTTEWKSQVLWNYQRRTRTADALIAGVYLAGANFPGTLAAMCTRISPPNSISTAAAPTVAFRLGSGATTTSVNPVAASRRSRRHR
jgi:putative transposase